MTTDDDFTKAAIREARRRSDDGDTEWWGDPRTAFVDGAGWGRGYISGRPDRDLEDQIARVLATEDGFGPDHPDHEITVGEFMSTASALVPLVKTQMAKAWEESRDTLALALMSPVGEDRTRRSPANPYARDVNAGAHCDHDRLTSLGSNRDGLRTSIVQAAFEARTLPGDAAAKRDGETSWEWTQRLGRVQAEQIADAVLPIVAAAEQHVRDETEGAARARHGQWKFELERAEKAEARIEALLRVLENHESLFGDSLGVPVERIRRALG